MTTPVLIHPAPGQKTMSFVLPQSIESKGVPEPGGSEVCITQAQPGRYAVLRFKGRGSPKNQQLALEKLQAWLGSHGIAEESEPIFAYYDPPWTPGFLRRNEVMVRVAQETS